MLMGQHGVKKATWVISAKTIKVCQRMFPEVAVDSGGCAIVLRGDTKTIADFHLFMSGKTGRYLFTFD